MSTTDSSGWPELNRAQQAAVTASLEPQLVVAGPGTGKTRVLICRAAHLIEERGLTPSHLVLVTFTRRAARQLTDRLARLVGPDAQHVRAGTIHHFCYELLREYPDAADTPEDFIVVDDAVTDAFWQRWYQQHERWCEDNYLNSYRQVKTHVSRIKLGIDTVSGRLTKGLRTYNQMLADRGALDFDDLLVKTRDLLRDYPDVRAAIADGAEAVLVDEFQDTDPVQFDIIRRLGEEGSHLFCVADDDQSVYRFRGARPENLRRYIERFDCTPENGTRHVLGTNYRSNRSIYDVAETVLDGEGRLKQRGAVRTLDDGVEPVRLVPCADAEAERDFALAQVRRWIEEGANRSEIAVLTRWNRRLQALERDFLSAGLACETSSSEDLLEAPPAQKLHALLRVVDARRRNRPIDTPMAELLERMLPDDAMARLRDFGERQMPEASAWTVFQTLVSNERARRSAGLDQPSARLDRVYATITNLLQTTQEDGLTIGTFTEDALHQLGDPLQLLTDRADALRDPNELPSFRAAGSMLKDWLDAQDAPDPPRLLLHHRTPQITRLWRQLVRRALGIETDPPQPLPEAQEALFARPAEEGIPPLGDGDVILTTDLEGLLRWAERTGAFPDDREPPRILLLAPEASLPDEQQALLGIDADAVTGVDADTTFHSPSVRLWKLLQMATGPAAPEPLFPEYVMVDLEATGTDPRQCRVAEVGALKVRDGAVVDRFSALVELPDDLTDDEEQVLRTVCGLDPDTDFTDARPEADRTPTSPMPGRRPTCGPTSASLWAPPPSSPTTASATTSGCCAAWTANTTPTHAGRPPTTCCPPPTSSTPTSAATPRPTSASTFSETRRRRPIAPWPTARTSSASWRTSRKNGRSGTACSPTSRCCPSSLPPSRTSRPRRRPSRVTRRRPCRWATRGPCAMSRPPATTCARSCPAPSPTGCVSTTCIRSSTRTRSSPSPPACSPASPTASTPSLPPTPIGRFRARRWRTCSPTSRSGARRRRRRART